MDEEEMLRQLLRLRLSEVAIIEARLRVSPTSQELRQKGKEYLSLLQHGSLYSPPDERDAGEGREKTSR